PLKKGIPPKQLPPRKPLKLHPAKPPAKKKKILLLPVQRRQTLLPVQPRKIRTKNRRKLRLQYLKPRRGGVFYCSAAILAAKSCHFYGVSGLAQPLLPLL